MKKFVQGTHIEFAVKLKDICDPKIYSQFETFKVKKLIARWYPINEKLASAQYTFDPANPDRVTGYNEISLSVPNFGFWLIQWYSFVTQPMATDLLGQPRTKRFNPKRSSVCVFWPYFRPDSDDQAYVGQQLRRHIPTGGINADKVWYGGTAEFAKPVSGYVEITAVVCFHRRQSAVPAGIAKYDQLSEPRPYRETLQPILGLHSADSESNLSDNE